MTGSRGHDDARDTRARPEEQLGLPAGSAVNRPVLAKKDKAPESPLEWIDWALDQCIQRGEGRSNCANYRTKALLVALARHADGDGKCFPSKATLARRLGCDRSQVSRDCTWLERHWFISQE